MSLLNNILWLNKCCLISLVYQSCCKNFIAYWISLLFFSHLNSIFIIHISFLGHKSGINNVSSIIFLWISLLFTSGILFPFVGSTLPDRFDKGIEILGIAHCWFPVLILLSVLITYVAQSSHPITPFPGTGYWTFSLCVNRGNLPATQFLPK